MNDVADRRTHRTKTLAPQQGCHCQHCDRKRVRQFHDPTDHHMRSWPLHWRGDRQIFERMCAHWIGHPDPDQFAYWEETQQDSQGVHGCDGCCAKRGAE